LGFFLGFGFLGERLDKKAADVVFDRTMSLDAKQHHWATRSRRT
jgi:hypothetical protein